MSSDDLPIIDLKKTSQNPGAVADELFQACTKWGFFYIKNHGIPQEHIDGIFDLGKAFFAQSDNIKAQTPYVPSQNAGYYRTVRSYSERRSQVHDGDRVKRRKTDPREAFAINKWIDDEAKNTAELPPVLSENRDQIRVIQEELHEFAMKLLESIAIAIGLPKTEFTDRHHRRLANLDNFELMHYPAVGPDEEIENRIKPHTDWGSITLLFQQKLGGLQVRPPRYTSPTVSQDEVWIDVPVHEDMVLINIGDMMEFWTAGRLKSTWHRVSAKSNCSGPGGVTDRFCFAYFLHPDRDCVLRPIEGLKHAGFASRYEGEGETAAQHVAARISRLHGDAVTTQSRQVLG